MLLFGDFIRLVEFVEDFLRFVFGQYDGDAGAGFFELHAEDGFFDVEDVLEEECHGVERLFLRGIRAVFILDDGGEEPGGGFHLHDCLRFAGELGVSCGPCAVAELGAMGQATARTGGFDGGAHPLGEAAVIGTGLRTGIEPVEIPFDGVAPLVDLPVFADAALADDFGFPKDRCGIAPGGEFVAKAEVFVPFEEDEESGAVLVGEAAEFGEVVAPAPAGFGGCCYAHGGKRAC